MHRESNSAFVFKKPLGPFGVNQMYYYVLLSDFIMCPCGRKLEVQPGRTTEPFSWPRRRSREPPPLLQVKTQQLRLYSFQTDVSLSQIKCFCSLLHVAAAGASQRKSKAAAAASSSVALLAPSGVCYGEGTTAASGGLTLRDPVSGTQYVQIQLLQVGLQDLQLWPIFDCVE